MSKSNYLIDPLRKDNFDTWSVQAQAVLIKNSLWEYVEGTAEKPNEAVALKAFEAKDLLAKSELLLLISPSELKQVKNCKTAAEIWKKLSDIYQSKGPARKAMLLKQIVTKKMQEGSDVREHLNMFLDIIDKLKDMNVEINSELMSIMMLYSLPSSFENFRIAIETRDTLPTPEELKVKIIEENDARKNNGTQEESEGAFYSKPRYRGRSQNYNGRNKEHSQRNSSKITCYRCHRRGHKAQDCRVQGENSNSNFKIEEMCLSSYSKDHDTSQRWCLDSGCTSHMCCDASLFEKIFASPSDKILRLAAVNSTAEVKGIGKVILKINGQQIKLWDTLYVPSLTSNLMSVAKIAEKGFHVFFQGSKATVRDNRGRCIVTANREKGLYYVDDEKNEVARLVEKSSIQTWHRKLAHLNEKDLRKMMQDGGARGLSFSPKEKLQECEVCIEGKMSRMPFKKVEARRTTRRLEIVHSDVCGPMSEMSPGGSKYFVTFIDDYSRYGRVYFLAYKSEVLQKFIEFKNEMERFTGEKIKNLQTDNGGEYLSHNFENYLKKCGIARRTTAPYTPQQNGIAERKNRTLMEKARCMLIDADLPETYWAEATYTANYLCNRIPTANDDKKTPYEKWTGRIPSLNHLQIFGSKVHVLQKGKRRPKFASRTDEGIFMGYSESSKAYRVWMIRENRIVISRDVKVMDRMYFEKHLIKNEEDNRSEERLNVEINGIEARENETPVTEEVPHLESAEVEESEDVHVDPQEEDEEEPARMSTRARKTPSWMEDFHVGGVCAEDGIDEGWEQAITAEMFAHVKNETWDIVDETDDARKISCRMVLKEKLGSDGKIERKKARLVARGFSQISGIDFQETFAPVSRLSSIRTMIAVAVEEKMKIDQLDVTTAYLNGELEENILMEKPENLEKYLSKIISQDRDPSVTIKAKNMLKCLKNGKKAKVCRLKKAIYGLKQAGRQWYEKLNQVLIKMGFISSSADPCIYVLKKGREKVIVAVYVDDILIAYSQEKLEKFVKQKLAESFEIRDLGKINYCLGINFEIKEDSISLCQTEYLKRMLQRFDMIDCKPVTTPMEPGLRLEKAKESKGNPYRELIGSLMYAAVATRPDLMFCTSYLSQFNDAHAEEHWKAAKRVLRYLKGTMDTNLTYKRTGHRLEGFADADWATCTVDRRSYTGYCFKYAGSIISWESKKQRTVALSTAEAEYMALVEATKEAIHLKRLLEEMTIPGGCIKIWTDNQAALNLVKNPIVSKRSKHMDIRGHFIKEKLEEKVIEICYKRTEDMEADIFTKALPSPRIVRLMLRLGASCRREGECNRRSGVLRRRT